jgi:predicted ATP-grasp superfamily ATP-dependent carboligase
MTIAIVTNAKSRMAYCIAKSLGQKGIDVITADFVPLSMAFGSRYSKRHFLYPSPFREPHAFIKAIIENARLLKADVLIPVFEETFLLSKFKDRVSQHIKMAIPDYDQILITHNKDQWQAIAQSLSIPVPFSASIDEIRNGNPETLRYPVLIKPKQGGGAWGIVQADSKKDLLRLLAKDHHADRPWNRFFVQEKIKGTVYCVAILMNQGTIKGHVVYRQLRDLPFTGGQATLRISVDKPDIVALMRKLLESLEWHGICQADFLVEEETGTPYLIDINPRFWGSLVQGIASGVDFPYMLYRIAAEGDVPETPDFKKEVMTRWLWGDLRTLPEALKHNDDKLKFLMEYCRLFKLGIALDDFSFKDPVPFLTFGFDIILKMLQQRTLHPSSHDSLQGIWE